MGTAFTAVLIAGQVFIGDIVYGTMLKYQPSKMQAAEGYSISSCSGRWIALHARAPLPP